MLLIPDVLKVATRGYSMKAFYALIMLEGSMLALIQLSPELAPSSTTHAILVLLMSTLGGVLRLLAQPELSEVSENAQL